MSDFLKIVDGFGLYLVMQNRSNNCSLPRRNMEARWELIDYKSVSTATSVLSKNTVFPFKGKNIFRGIYTGRHLGINFSPIVINF